MKFAIKIIILQLILNTAALAANHKVVGWIEDIQLYPESISIPAKLDTGAKMSSIDATHIHHFTRNDADWVRFDVRIQGKTITLEKPIAGRVKVKLRRLSQKLLGKMYTKRPVVEMDICLAGERHTTQVNLVDRKHFDYPFLVGRNTIREFHTVIDPKIKNTYPPVC